MYSKRDRYLRKLPARIRVPLFYYLLKLQGCAERELSHLPEMVPQHKRAIDIGANNGAYVFPLSSLAETVEAFEPQPACADFVEGFRRNVTVHRVALSDHDGRMTLHVPLIHGIRYSGLATFHPVNGTQEMVEVPVQRLDSFRFTNVGFIKIDVEGHELSVLHGAEETIRREQPNLLVEIEQRHLSEPMDHVIESIEALGYDGFFLQNDGFRPVAEFSYECHQAPFVKEVQQGNDAVVRGRYINNFFFRPKHRTDAA